MSRQPSISSREFSHLIWTPGGRGFDLDCDFRFVSDKGIVETLFAPPEEFQGGPGNVHGGVLAALMDEAQGSLCFHLGHFVMTDRLTTEYKKATPVGRPVRITARVTTARRRKLFTRGQIEDEAGNILVCSSARWYLLAGGIQERMKKRYPPGDWEKIQTLLEANRRRRKNLRQM